MIDKALGLDADALMLDIEDGVAPSEKDQARRLIGEALGRERGPREPLRYVRINAIGHQRMADDLAAVLRPGLDGLVPAQGGVAGRDRDGRVPGGGTRGGPRRGGGAPGGPSESPKGLLAAPAIAGCSPRVVGLMFGAEGLRPGVGAAHVPRGGGAGSPLRALRAGGGGGLGACPGGGRRLGGSSGPRRTGAVRAAIAAPGLHRHVVDPSVPDRADQRCVQPQAGGNRTTPERSSRRMRRPPPGATARWRSAASSSTARSSSGRAGPLSSPRTLGVADQ